MVRAELTVLSRGALAGRVGPVETATVAGVEYLAFEADALTERDLGFLGLASAFYALFEADGELLRPVAVVHAAGEQRRSAGEPAVFLGQVNRPHLFAVA